MTRLRVEQWEIMIVSPWKEFCFDKASCAQGPIPSSPRHKICRVVLALNHSKRKDGPLVELNERVNSEKSAIACRTMQRASRIVDRRGGGGRFVENVNSKFDSRRLPPHVSRCVISMPYGTNVDAQVFNNTHSSFLYYRSVSIGHPCIRSPLYSLSLFLFFFVFFFFFFFNRNLSRSLLLLLCIVDARRGSISGISVQRYPFFYYSSLSAGIFHPRRDDSSGLCWSPQREIHGERTGYINKIYFVSFKYLQKLVALLLLISRYFLL